MCTVTVVIEITSTIMSPNLSLFTFLYMYSYSFIARLDTILRKFQQVCINRILFKHAFQNDILSAVLIILCGLFINGPYALITTAVSNDLVSHIIIILILRQYYITLIKHGLIYHLYYIRRCTVSK